MLLINQFICLIRTFIKLSLAPWKEFFAHYYQVGFMRRHLIEWNITILIAIIRFFQCNLTAIKSIKRTKIETGNHSIFAINT